MWPRVSSKPGGSISIFTENCFKLMQALRTLGEGMRSSWVSAFRDRIQQCGFRENKLLAQASRWLSSQRAHLQCRRNKRCGFNPWVGKIPWGRAWQPTPVSSPGESQGQRSLAGYSPRGHRESDATETIQHTRSTAQDWVCYPTLNFPLL